MLTMEVVWTRCIYVLAVWLVTGSPSVVGANGLDHASQKTKDSSPSLALGKVLELLQLMESKLEKNAEEVQQVETFKVNSQSSILKRVGKPANPSRMEFEDYKRNKTMGNGTEYVLQSDTADNEIFAKEVQSNKTGFGNVTSGSFGNSDKSSANVTFSGISSVQSDKSLANTTFGIGGLQSEKTANTT